MPAEPLPARTMTSASGRPPPPVGATGSRRHSTSTSAVDAAPGGGPRVVVARLFNAVGSGQVGRHGMVLPRFVAAAAGGGVLAVHGDGGQSRCFCDARDTAAGLEQLLLGGSSGVFNLGGDRSVTIRSLAETVRHRALALGLPGGRIELRPRGEAYGKAFEEPRQRVPDLTRIRAATGWSARIPLEEPSTNCCTGRPPPPVRCLREAAR